MISEKLTPPLLGAMFLIVIVTSALGGMQSAVTGTGSISDILVAVSNKPAQMQWTALANVVNSLGIVALAVLLYSVLKRQNPILALVALGWWLGEALFCAMSQIGAFALVPLSLEFVKAGAPAQSYYQSLGAFLYQGIAKTGYVFPIATDAATKTKTNRQGEFSTIGTLRAFDGPPRPSWGKLSRLSGNRQ